MSPLKSVLAVALLAAAPVSARAATVLDTLDPGTVA